MKIWVLSDLHLPMSDLDWEISPPDADVCVVAGDVCDPPAESVRWLAEYIGRHMPVVFVAGNHEYYGQTYDHSLDEALSLDPSVTNVHFLENRAVVIGGVRFLGATMWTDFEFYERPDESMRYAYRSMNDYRAIMFSDRPPTRLTPLHTRDVHMASRAWLEARLSEAFDGPTVVVTHTSPHERSVAQEYAGDALNPAFVSDFSALIDRHAPPLWIHGHTHTSFDYVLHPSVTRVVCNPRGYVRRWNMGYQVENMNFERYKIVEV